MDNERERLRQNGPESDSEAAPVLSKIPFERSESNFMASFDADESSSVRELSLCHVFGYRGYDARANVDFLFPSTGPEEKLNRLVYHSAGIATVHDFTENRQQFYTGHSDDILCLTQNLSLIHI